MTRSATAIMTGSGRFFDPINPKPGDVFLGDISRGLRRSIRFNGQLLDPAECPHPQSGASHCMRVARLTFWRLTPRSRSAEDLVVHVLAAALHDAPEGYTGDRLGPIKTEADKAMEAGVLAAIVEHLLGKDYVNAIVAAASWEAVKWADNMALVQEALIYQPGARVWASADPIEIAESLHLFYPREGEDWARTTMEISSMLLTGITEENSAAVMARLAKLMA